MFKNNDKSLLVRVSLLDSVLVYLNVCKSEREHVMAVLVNKGYKMESLLTIKIHSNKLDILSMDNRDLGLPIVIDKPLGFMKHLLLKMFYET